MTHADDHASPLARDPQGGPRSDPGPEAEAELLTRQEASAYLAAFHIRLKPASLARMWSVGGNGPPCRHIRGKPWYARCDLRDWALAQTTGLRRNARDAALGGDRP